MQSHRRRPSDIVGYVISLIIAVGTGIALVRSGSSFSLVILLAATAWAGGIYFLLLKQGEHSD